MIWPRSAIPSPGSSNPKWCPTMPGGARSITSTAKPGGSWATPACSASISPNNTAAPAVTSGMKPSCTKSLSRRGISGFGQGVHSICANYVFNHGTEAQKQRWLPRLAAGELIGAIAMTEPAAGSDLRGVRTRAVREGDVYRINGSKIFITNGSLATLLLLLVKTDPEARKGGMSLHHGRDRRSGRISRGPGVGQDGNAGPGHRRAVLR